MPRISGQMLVYLLVGAVVVLVGLNSIRGGKTDPVPFGPDASTAATEASDTGEGGLQISGGDRKLIVDVAGAVRRPGVYRFARGARVIDAIKRAGGTTRNAETGAINRAATLSDGQQVVVPAASGPAGPGAAPGSVVPGAAGEGPVSLGTATQEQLEGIDGIGPVTAGKIIEFRDSKGGLGSIEELEQISGIGPVTMESLRTALAP